jgi:arginine deiminase
MWTVRSEAGVLKSVMVHDVGMIYWELLVPNLESHSFRNNILFEKAREQQRLLFSFLREQNVQLFEITELLKDIVSEASAKEKEDIVATFWKENEPRPAPSNLTWENIAYGYPFPPMYDEVTDSVKWPDRRRVTTYARDTSFMTPMGMIISKMKEWSRREEPRVTRFVLRQHPNLNENIRIAVDADNEFIDGSSIEGGDVLIVDEETIAVGISRNSNIHGFHDLATRIFASDDTNQIKYIVSVSHPMEDIWTFGHLDTTINFVDEGKAIVMPYIHTSKKINMPRKKLLIELVKARRIIREQLKQPLDIIANLATLPNAGECDVYTKNADGKPVKSKHVDSFIDWLLEEGKLDSDGVIMVGGQPEKENDIMHVVHAWQDQARQAGNVLALKPGLIVAYQTNFRTLESLRDHGVRVLELPCTYLDLWGGPHCMTCPLERDPI